jgi:hypothetical protein
MIDWPVSALQLKEASISAISATSSTVVKSLSTVAQHHLLDHSLSEMSVAISMCLYICRKVQEPAWRGT